MPMKKNGAKGMNFCFFHNPHTPPKTQEAIKAIASPVIPSQIPPAANNFTSPRPIASGDFFLNAHPIPRLNRYPTKAAIAAVPVSKNQGKNATIISPINKNGNK